jgi:hypothetical protein
MRCSRPAYPRPHFLQHARHLLQFGVESLRCKASNSDSAMVSQSPGLPESVFQGMDYTLFHGLSEEMVVARAFLGQLLRRNGQQRECWTGPDISRDLAKSPDGLQLPFRAIGDQVQVHLALRPRLPARVGAEWANGPPISAQAASLPLPVPAGTLPDRASGRVAPICEEPRQSGCQKDALGGRNLAIVS